MIPKSIFVFLLVTAAYVLSVPFFPKPAPGLQGGSQWEKNSMKAEQLLFKDNDNCEVVIIGSSITAGIVDIPETWMNLSMATKSAVNGAELLVMSDLDPCTIVVEANHFNTGSGDEFDFSSFDLKNYHPAFLTENKPSHVSLRVLGTVMGIKADRGSRKKKSKGSVDTIVLESENKSELFKQVLERRLDTCSKTMDKEQLEQRSARLEQAITKLVSRGFRCVFVEVPESPSTFDSPLRKQYRSQFRELFADESFDWFDDFDVQKYATRDAVHLDPPSKQMFTDQLVEHIEKITKAPAR